MAEFDLTAEITAVLKDYTGNVMDKVDEAVEYCSKGMRKEISTTSPQRTKIYSKGWRNKITTISRGNKTALVYNETNYQLTHLLEKPHKKRGGQGLTTPKPHISPAEKRWTEEFERRCEEACKAE